MADDSTRSMLSFLGLKSAEELFSDIPERFRVRDTGLPPGITEFELIEMMQAIASKTKSEGYMSFLGAGIYDVFTPSIVQQVISRSELYTAYTPYQAEMSQGLLQLIFEYQSLMSELTGMEAVNASMYDGSSALGEAALMSLRIHEGRHFAIPRALAPWKKAVLINYLAGTGISLREYAFDSETGEGDTADIVKVGRDACGLLVEMPGFFGVFQSDIDEIKGKLGNVPLVVGVNPASLAVVKPPGEYGADIVVGEGQSLGLQMNYGGPLLGILACKKELVRKMPGRIVGATVDQQGRRAFCLTLQAREQHIRRERATSNICTNQTLLAIAASVYMAAMGSDGLRNVASRTIANRRKAIELFGSGRCAIKFGGLGYNEFVVVTEGAPDEINRKLLQKGIVGGLPLSSIFPELGNASLWAVTEKMKESDLISARKAMEEIL